MSVANDTGDRFRASDYPLGGLGLSDLNFESAMNSLLSRSRYGTTGSMPLYQPGGYGDSYRRTWSLDPARAGAGARQPAKRPAAGVGRSNITDEPRRGPVTRGNARPGATNTRSSTGASPTKLSKPLEAVTKIAIPNLENLLKLSGNKEAIIGLKFIVETINEVEGEIQSCTYKCQLCSVNNKSPAQILSHIIDKNHRMAYIKDQGLEEVEDKDLPKRAAAIEAVHGRGKWTTNRESKGLKKFDKSAFVVKKKKGGKAGGDVEMVDVERNNKDPQLRDGDVVVDELTPAQVNEDVPDPKFFVLQVFDQLVGKDFSVESETEAMIVDSIIQKLDTALFTYSKKAPKVVDEVAEGEDENKNGNSLPVGESEVKDEATMEA